MNPHVYFVFQGKRECKIGMSQNEVNTRFKKKTDMCKFRFAGSIDTPLCDMLEKELHIMLNPRRITREFFNISNEEATFIIESWDTPIEDVIPEFEKINRLMSKIADKFYKKENIIPLSQFDVEWSIKWARRPFGRDGCQDNHGETYTDLRPSSMPIEYRFHESIKEFVDQVVPNIKNYKPSISRYSMYNIIRSMKISYDNAMKRDYKNMASFECWDFREITEILEILKFGPNEDLEERTISFLSKKVPDRYLKIGLMNHALPTVNIEFWKYIENYVFERRKAWDKKRKEIEGEEIKNIDRNSKGNLMDDTYDIVFISPIYHDNMLKENVLKPLDFFWHKEYEESIPIKNLIAIGIQDHNSPEKGLSSVLPLDEKRMRILKHQKFKVLDWTVLKTMINELTLLKSLIS